MSDVQKQTIARYYSFLQSVAVASALQNAKKLRLIDTLFESQKNLEQIAKACELEPSATEGLLRILVAIGFLERYGEDYALSQAARLMVGFDSNFGEEIYSALPEFLKKSDSTGNNVEYRTCIAGRQWTHTAAAIQAAEVLEIGDTRKGARILELGTASGVWTAAMTYRDPTIEVTAIDAEYYLAQCRETFQSIELQGRLHPIAADYRTWDVPLAQYDLVVLPEVLQLESDADAVILLGRAADALRPGGEVVIVERLNESDGPELALATNSLEISIATHTGKQRSVAEIDRLLRGAGFHPGRWGWLTASLQGLGLIVAKRKDNFDEH